MNKNADEVIVMNCPYCNFPNSPDSRFCENCGAPLPPTKNKSHTGLIAVITIVILAAIGGITALLLMNSESSSGQASVSSESSAVPTKESVSPIKESDISSAKTSTPTTEASIPTTAAIITTTEAAEPVTFTVASSIPSGLSGAYAVTVTGASATSTIVQSGYDNSALCVADGRAETSWQEGVAGSGIGESVSLQYDGTHKIQYMSFQLGNWRDNDYFYGNNRPQTLSLEFTGGPSADAVYTIDFPSDKSVYYLEFSSPVEASAVRLTIKNVYSGTSWDDTCIAEVTAYAVR